MRQSLVVLILLGIASFAQSQNVLGFSDAEVKSYFKSNYPDLILDPNVRNDTYSYLKYVDINSNLVTALVFMDHGGHCSSVRFIYDLSMEEEIIEELNSKYIKTKRNMWIDVGNVGKVNIYYKKEEWFITVNYKAE